MPERYQGPIQHFDSGKVISFSRRKWLRTGTELYTSTHEEGERTVHVVIANALKIRAKVEELKQSDPTQVDGGMVQIDNINRPPVVRQEIRIYGDSESLDLPVEAAKEEARAISVKVWKQQSPGFDVRSE